MNLTQKIKSFTAMALVCLMLATATLTSCKKGDASAEEETTEHPKSDSTEHPKSDSEHPKSDSTDTKKP
jgi:hypothetical protein